MNSKADTKTMNQEKKRELKPKLRFPEFWDSGEWEEKPLGEICTFIRGPFGGSLKKDIFVKDGYAVYEQSHAIYQTFDSFRYYIAEDKFNELKRFAVHPNDLIMSCSGTMGKFAIIPKESKRGVINQALLKLTAKKELDIRFIKTTMELPSSQEKLLSQSAGGAIKNVVAVGQIKEITLHIPSIPEQKKITDCLSSIDDRITAETQKLSTLKAHKKGLMQQLFPAEGETVPDRRFPEFCDAGEWEEKKIGEVCDCIVPGRDKPRSFTGDIPWITIPDIQGQRIYSSISQLGLSVDEIKECGAKIVPKNSVIMSCVGTFGLISICEQDLVINQQLHAWLPNPRINNYYLAYSLILQKKQMERIATNTTIAYLNKSSCNSIKIPLPALIEQKKIADCLCSLDELITAQTQKIDTLKIHKKGLMQQLFPAVEDPIE